MKEKLTTAIEALDWLQQDGGVTLEDAEAFRAEVCAEREAGRQWWEA